MAAHDNQTARISGTAASVTVKGMPALFASSRTTSHLPRARGLRAQLAGISGCLCLQQLQQSSHDSTPVVETFTCLLLVPCRWISGADSGFEQPSLPQPQTP